MVSQTPEASGSFQGDETSTDAPAKTEEGLVANNEEVKAMKQILETLTNAKDESGHFISVDFQRMVNKRSIPDYFEIIKEPVAFSTIRSKFQKKEYKSFSEFVRDLALVSHNAQVYNRPSSSIHRDAVSLREKFEAELQKLVDKEFITKEVATLPYLGELPPAEETGPEEEEAEDDEDDEDDEEDDDDSGDELTRKRPGRRARRSSVAAKREAGKTEEKEDPDAHKVRGRPPKVPTPMEARINALLKGLRKPKNPGGDLKILHFEKLPDNQTMPEYYQEIQNPMALDIIKKKAKRKKYHSVDQVLKDLELMFENAKRYNVEDSQVYRDAVDLQKEARSMAEQEKKKPDSDYADAEGKVPLAQILHNGEIWKVGDWVHIMNPNDVTKPIVAQIYRTWQDQEGEKWVNACWYYRPEQTVHRYEKHFYENEVMKTGQYRDHRIDEVVDRCFVMFFTRYSKGRPRGFPLDKEVYVCEARYNEDRLKLNKIKTWASCLPDEVREKDYEMDLFDVPRKMKKVPSPIKHLLQEDAKEDDPLPKPTFSNAHAPPLVGAVHRRPREANESPPPEPTPSPPPQPPAEPVRQFQVAHDRSGGHDTSADMYARLASSARSPATAQHQSQGSYGQQFGPSRPSASPAPHLQHHSSYGSHTSQHPPAPRTPQFGPNTSYNQYSNQPVPTASPAHNATPNPLTSYEQFPRSSTGIRSTMPITSSSDPNSYNPPRNSEVYHLSDNANATIPADIRSQFHRDEHNRVLFFTTPPLDIPAVPETSKTLGHSVQFLAARVRARVAAKQAAKNETSTATETGDGARPKEVPNVTVERAEQIRRLKSSAMELFAVQMNAGTELICKNLYGDEWKTVMDSESQRLSVLQDETWRKRKAEEGYDRQRADDKKVKLTRNGLFP